MNPFVRDNLKLTLSGKKILLGISGSIAAFKACDTIRGLRELGAEVKVVLTESAQKFVTPITLETLSGHPVYTSLWGDGHGTHHIDAARWADLALVAPATANTMAKIALGLGDDLLSTELLAFQGPLVIVPAMNPAMYSHPATQSHVTTLRARGVTLVGPTTGITACGEEGLGRMVEADEIIEALADKFYRPQNGKHALITLGPTRSALDPVRYLTNRSSGLMGAALAWAAQARGYKVTVISGPADVSLPKDCTKISVTTAKQLAEAALELWPGADFFLSAAAVLDWDFKQASAQKLKKESGAPSLELEKNIDILASISKAKKPEQFVLGFAAETQDHLKNAQTKLLTKKCDAVFVNDVLSNDTGFESTNNAGLFVTSTTVKELPLTSKAVLAQSLWNEIEATIPRFHEQAPPPVKKEKSISHAQVH